MNAPLNSQMIVMQMQSVSTAQAPTGASATLAFSATAKFALK